MAVTEPTKPRRTRRVNQSLRCIICGRPALIAFCDDECRRIYRRRVLDKSQADNP